MQVSKISAALCVLMLGCTASLQAADNPAQAAARAAIAAKLFEVSNSSTTNKADAAKTAEAKVIKEAAKKAEAQQAAAMASAQKLAEAKAAEQKAAEIAAAKKQAKASITQAKTQPAAQPKAEVITKSATTKDTPAQAQAREALAHSLFESSANGNSATKPTTPSAPAPKAGMTAPVVGVAPPLPINASKQQQLSTLLAKYKADQITPEEYQRQRATILAQP
jgi:trimeric autotransporter adhesin